MPCRMTIWRLKLGSYPVNPVFFRRAWHRCISGPFTIDRMGWSAIKCLQAGSRSALSIRAAVFLGFGLILGLWLFAWYAMSLRIAEAQRRTADINARCTNAQETLSRIADAGARGRRNSRDALLNPARAHPRVRPRASGTLHDDRDLLSHYVPWPIRRALTRGLRRLRKEPSMRIEHNARRAGQLQWEMAN